MMIRIQTSLLYYLPSSKIVKSSDDIYIYDYIITSVKNPFNVDQSYKSIRKFADHILLMKISE